MPVALDDKYTALEGRVFLTGLQALVRLPMAQMRRDRASGLDTAAFITGYRGSPLGGYDQQLEKAAPWLAEYGIKFQPGVNEDLAATAVWGTQQLGLYPGARKDGVVGIWYGKGPGVDRSGDALKHGNAAGSSKYGGVLCLAGDDHSCKSSSIPHQSDHAFMSALMPVLYPSSVHEFLEYGLLGIAMSRYSGCWVGMKFISDTAETTASVDLSQERRSFVIPTDFELPPDGLNLRWPDPPLVQDERLQNLKGYAAIAFARANRVDQVTHDAPGARFGITASGKAYEDVLQALKELGLGAAERRAIGMRILKVRMPWPLEPDGIRHFSEGLEEVLVVEERREIVENQIKQQLFNWRADVRPRIVGKFDEKDQPFLSLSESLTVGAVARAIADRLLHFEFDAGLKARIAEKLDYLDRRGVLTGGHVAPLARVPYFCSGCPHNTSTRVPEGSRATAGIGCHFMVQWMDRRTETFTHMGAEGVSWVGIAPFTDDKHLFVNIGDGTYFHSGIMAIRQAVAAKVNITYKVLYNDAVAMTGGQHVDGPLTPELVTEQLHAEGVKPIYLLAEKPEDIRTADLAPGTILLPREEIDRVMLEIREIPGCSAIVYVQTCAAEKRRRRSRGLLEDPPDRVYINAAVCEGCGDCSVQSNCVSVEPLETPMGRKRRINQSTCNKDYSCLKGFCPSFVTVHGGTLRKRAARERPDVSALPQPNLPSVDERPWNIAIAGVGGTGILTVGAIIGMAAHLDGKAPMILDMAGLAQKGGSVMSNVRIGARHEDVTSPRIVTGGADLLIAADSVVAASKESVTLCAPERTRAVVNVHRTPVADFVRHRDFDFRTELVERTVRQTVSEDSSFLDFSQVSEALLGDAIGANIMMAGYAWQKGLLPLTLGSIDQAIALNGVAVEANRAAFDWGRLLAADAVAVEPLLGAKPEKSLGQMSLDEIIEHRSAHLVAYQGRRLAKRYRALVERVRKAAADAGLGEAVPREVAHVYARLLAYKDEYEVARLLSAPKFREELKSQFDGDYKISLNLAPPFLPGTDVSGRPKKRSFGAWMLPVMRVLKSFRKLRGTPLDPFGWSAERRQERALPKEYAALVDRVLPQLTPAKEAAAVALLGLYGEIRGYGPVKAAALEDVRRREPELLAAFEAARPSDETKAAA